MGGCPEDRWSTGQVQLARMAFPGLFWYCYAMAKPEHTCGGVGSRRMFQTRERTWQREREHHKWSLGHREGYRIGGKVRT